MKKLLLSLLMCLILVLSTVSFAENEVPPPKTSPTSAYTMNVYEYAD